MTARRVPRVRSRPRAQPASESGKVELLALPVPGRVPRPWPRGLRRQSPETPAAARGRSQGRLPPPPAVASQQQLGAVPLNRTRARAARERIGARQNTGFVIAVVPVWSSGSQLSQARNRSRTCSTSVRAASYEPKDCAIGSGQNPKTVQSNWLKNWDRSSIRVGRVQGHTTPNSGFKSPLFKACANSVRNTPGRVGRLAVTNRISDSDGSLSNEIPANCCTVRDAMRQPRDAGAELVCAAPSDKRVRIRCCHRPPICRSERPT